MSLLIRGATVYDGSGAPAAQRDVAVDAGRIVALGDDAHQAPDTDRVLDAGGLALAPGFIDMHSHADATLPAFPGATNSITQGVTSELVGLCGFSVAPVSNGPERAAHLHDLIRGFGPDLDWSWHSFGEYLQHFDQARPTVNVMPLVGHHALRILAMGVDDRSPVPDEIALMQQHLAEALEQGAWGMSSGLVYVPGMFASTEELVEVGKALQAADALYVSHIRDESDALVQAVDEAISIGEQLGIRAQVSHLKITARQNAGKIGAAIERLQAARDRGARVHADVYPYIAGSTYLHQVLPPWVKVGGLDAMVQRLQLPEHRHHVRHDIESGDGGWANQVAACGGWHNIMVTSVRNPARRSAEGGRVAELAAHAHADPLDYTLDLLVDDRGASTMVAFSMDERDMRTALSWRWSAVGSDQLGVTGPAARVHPRAYGTFARVLGWGVREAQLFPLETAIYKMTGLPAQILGLRDRGTISVGAVADLVLFDPSSVADEATYAEPTRTARGIEHVLLGGEFAIQQGAPVRFNLGHVLRRPADRVLLA